VSNSQATAANGNHHVLWQDDTPRCEMRAGIILITVWDQCGNDFCERKSARIASPSV